MSGTLSATYTMEGGSKVVKSETRTVTRGGVTETITKETVKTYINGSPRNICRTITTKEELMPVEWRHSSGSHSCSKWSPETTPKQENNSLPGQVLITDDQKQEKNPNEQKPAHIIIKLTTKSPQRTNVLGHGKDNTSSDSDSDNDHLAKKKVTPAVTKSSVTVLPNNNAVAYTDAKEQQKNSGPHYGDGSSSNPSSETAGKNTSKSFLQKFAFMNDHSGLKPLNNAKVEHDITHTPKQEKVKVSESTSSDSHSDVDNVLPPITNEPPAYRLVYFVPNHTTLRPLPIQATPDIKSGFSDASSKDAVIIKTQEPKKTSQQQDSCSDISATKNLNHKTDSLLVNCLLKRDQGLTKNGEQTESSDQSSATATIKTAESCTIIQHERNSSPYSDCEKDAQPTATNQTVTDVVPDNNLSTVTTEVVRIQTNGSSNSSSTTRLETTREHKQFEIRRGSQSSSSSSARESFSEKTSKSKLDSFFGKFRKKGDKTEKKASKNGVTSKTVKATKTSAWKPVGQKSSSDSESDEERQSWVKTKDNKSKSASITTNAENITSLNKPKTSTATIVMKETHKKAERQHSGSSSDSNSETTRKNKFQSLISKFNVKQDKTPSGKPTKPIPSNSRPKHHSSSSSESDDENKDFTKECLKHHNYYRAKHGVPNLKLSKYLCKYAQEWANKCARDNTSDHRPDHKYGENIFMKWHSDPKHKLNAKEPVEHWYSEINMHTFGTEPRNMSSGHFTQVVWKESKELGVGIARNKTGAIYVVANYDPPGNFLGSFSANVPPQISF